MARLVQCTRDERLSGEGVMSTFSVNFELPQELRDLGYSDDEIRREVPILLVLKRFRQGTISAGAAARILGMTRRDWLELLSREGIPLFDPTTSEFADELKTVRNLESR